MTQLVVPVPIPDRLAALMNRAPANRDRAARGRNGQPAEGDFRFEVRNAAGEDDTAAELLVYGEVSRYAWSTSVSATSFADALRQITASTLTVRLNSPGGDVFEGITIANLIKAHPANTTIVVDGLAASIASLIAIAGDRVVMAPQSQMMIHDAWGSAWGCNEAEMLEAAALLGRQSDNIAAAYQSKAGGKAISWRTRMKAETWYTDAEAVAAGLANEVGTVQTGTVGPSTADPAEGIDDGWWDHARTKVFDLAACFRYAGRAAAPAPDGQPTNSVVVDDTARKTATTAPTEPLPAQTGPEPAAQVVPAPAAPADDATSDQATEPAAPEPEPAPVFDWAAATAHLLIPPADAWAAATAHLLSEGA